jgi:hypothetical protein
MMNSLRRMLACVLILVLLGSACGVLKRPPPPRTANSPDGQSWLPAATATPSGLSNGNLIPITGENVVFMQCEFCVGEETHAVLMFPDSAYFDVDQSSPASCLTADVVNGRRILICRGPQSSSFNLSICSDPSNCLQFPVALQPCALLKGSVTVFTPGYLAPIDKKNTDGNHGPPPPANTPAPGSVPTNSPPQPTNPPPPGPQPTQEPKPTHQPQPTHEPKPTKQPKPTKMPKPKKPNH